MTDYNLKSYQGKGLQVSAVTVKNIMYQNLADCSFYAFHSVQIDMSRKGGSDEKDFQVYDNVYFSSHLFFWVM